MICSYRSRNNWRRSSADLDLDLYSHSQILLVPFRSCSADSINCRRVEKSVNDRLIDGSKHSGRKKRKENGRRLGATHNRQTYRYNYYITMCGCLMKSKLPVPSDKKQPLDEDPRGLPMDRQSPAAWTTRRGDIHNTAQSFIFRRKSHKWNRTRHKQPARELMVLYLTLHKFPQLTLTLTGGAARRQRKVLVALFFWSLEMKFAVELALFKIVNLIFANGPHFGTCITCS